MGRTKRSNSHNNNNKIKKHLYKERRGKNIPLLTIYRFALECIKVLDATCGAGFDSEDYIKVISHVSV